MRFLIDRCTGGRLANWLRQQGHDVLESSELGVDPGDRELLAIAARENRILVTIDTDFGVFLFREKLDHAGVVRLPDVPAARRISIFAELFARHTTDLESKAIITVRGNRIRISNSTDR